MAITDELREWIGTISWLDDSVSSAHKNVLAIADRIDAEHERMFRSLTIDTEPMTDESMAEHGWVRLPLDADGVPIHMGDVVRYDNLGNKGEPFEVKEITYRHGCEDEVGDGEQYGTIVAITVRHHHAPTVEDVLREFADAMSATNPLDVPTRIAE